MQLLQSDFNFIIAVVGNLQADKRHVSNIVRISIKHKGLSFWLKTEWFIGSVLKFLLIPILTSYLALYQISFQYKKTLFKLQYLFQKNVTRQDTEHFLLIERFLWGGGGGAGPPHDLLKFFFTLCLQGIFYHLSLPCLLFSKFLQDKY